MLDYHIHPGYSIDAEPFSVRDYCNRAVELGLKEIAITTHCEFDPLRSHLDWFVRLGQQTVAMHPVELWLDNYFQDITQCRDEYAACGLAVRVGLEAGYDLGLEKEIERVLNTYPFDFVIGSVHCIDHVAISSYHESEAYMPGRDAQEIAGLYFKTLAEAVDTGLFDVMGHLDIYRRHGSRFLDKTESVHSRFTEDILALMAKRGVGLELNTSSLRHQQGPFYPAPEIVEQAVRAGIPYFTVGSDCHRLSELGRGVEKAVEFIYQHGGGLAVFSGRQAQSLLLPRCFGNNSEK